jgi:hypothetical protein
VATIVVTATNSLHGLFVSEIEYQLYGSFMFRETWSPTASPAPSQERSDEKVSGEGAM